MTAPIESSDTRRRPLSTPLLRVASLGLAASLALGLSAVATIPAFADDAAEPTTSELADPAPVAEVPADETPADETPADETPAEETPSQEPAPLDDPAADKSAVDEPSVAAFAADEPPAAGPNQPPTPADDHYTMYQDTVLQVVTDAISLIANDSDPDGDDVDSVSFGTPSAGTIIGVNGSLGYFTYQPPAGFTGAVTFTYKGHDHQVPSLYDATVTIEVLPAVQTNTPPELYSDDYSVVSGQQLSVAKPGYLLNDFDQDGDPLTVLSVMPVEPAPSGQLYSFNADGSFDFTPAPGFTGLSAFHYFVSDGTVARDAYLVIDVIPLPGNVAPTAEDDHYSTTMGGFVFSGPPPGVLGNDTDPEGDVLHVVSWSTPSVGTLSAVNDLGMFVYEPPADFVGEATFTYVVGDAENEGSTATVTITVTAPDPDEPGTDEPGTDEPGTDEPGTDEPGTDEPSTDETAESGDPGAQPAGLASTGSAPSALAALAALFMVGAGGVTLLAARRRSIAVRR